MLQPKDLLITPSYFESAHPWICKEKQAAPRSDERFDLPLSPRIKVLRDVSPTS